MGHNLAFFKWTSPLDLSISIFVSIPYLDARQTISIDGNQLVIGGKQSNIKNVRIWEHGAETNIFNYHHVTSHYAVQVFSGSVRDILRQLHFVSTTFLIVNSKMKLDFRALSQKPQNVTSKSPMSLEWNSVADTMVQKELTSVEGNKSQI